MRIWPGQPYPLGATWDGEGVNFALFSENAAAVDLCLFRDPGEQAEMARIAMRSRTHMVWHVYLPDVRPGQTYGFRVHGPHEPSHGHRFNPSKLLLDPYAKAISGTIQWNDALFGYAVGDPGADLSFDSRDSAGFLPKSIVVDTAFTWGEDRPPRTPWNKTFIYEAHVKGMTVRHPDVPEKLRGTYLGLASEPVIEHLQGLGVTAIELMPVQHFITDRHLAEKDLTNYWGYNTIGYFAPDVRYASGGLGQQVHEFKSMVKILHKAGIEVILDVVYNHTGEGNHLGPTVCFRGVDNTSYYRVAPNDPRYYMDFTGCGNSMNMLNPRTVQLIMDSLRYWVGEMHVDGFRFDLAAALARELYEVDRLSRFFALIQQDPMLCQTKLIAEPWDLGEGGYQVGNFPAGWAEWNGMYRDTVRRFWRGDHGQIPDLAYRLSGSSDLYDASDRNPYASVNFVTCHDGFTLHDLVSYERKHNEANKEDNRDGTEANWSRNWGAEGPTDSPEVTAIREQIKRNLLATLAFSQGVPMILAGDEMGRSQGGNNNAYCQDNELSWVNWELTSERRRLLAFARQIFAIRRENAVFRRRSFFRGRNVSPGAKDVSWVRPDGAEMTDDDWNDAKRCALGMLIPGQATDETDERGRQVVGDTQLLVLNSGSKGIDFRLPRVEEEGWWREQVNTARAGSRVVRGAKLRMAPHSLVLLGRKGGS